MSEDYHKKIARLMAVPTGSLTVHGDWFFHLATTPIDFVFRIVYLPDLWETRVSVRKTVDMETARLQAEAIAVFQMRKDKTR